MRAGTENLPGIAAFGAAAEEARKSLNSSIKRMNELRSHAVNRLSTETEGIVFIGGGTPHILSLSMPGYPSEVVMNYLERDGICIAKAPPAKRAGGAMYWKRSDWHPMSLIRHCASAFPASPPWRRLTPFATDCSVQSSSYSPLSVEMFGFSECVFPTVICSLVLGTGKPVSGSICDISI